MITLDYHIKPRRIGRILGIIAVGLASISFIADYLVFFVFKLDVNSNIFTEFLEALSVTVEASIPTWYSVMLLFCAAILLAQITRAKRAQKDRYRGYWFGLAVIFAYLSADESAVLHETFSSPIEEAFNTSGFLTFGWLVVFIPLVIIFVLLYLRFLWNLPPVYRRLFVISGALYVGGAVFIEGLSASQFPDDGSSLPLIYFVLSTIEELSEMLGICLFIYTLLRYIVEMDYTFSFGSRSMVTVSASESPVATVPETPSQPEPPGLRFNPLIAIIILLIVTNSALLLWVFSNTGSSEEDSIDQPFYVTLDEQFADSDMLIVEMEGVFGMDNPAAQQMTAALLSNYAQVIVVALPENELSVAFAADTLPFDTTTLSNLLQVQAPAQYIIFDTPLVTSITTAAFPVISR
ncbi:MAG: hypothetical protein RLP44_05020 [Aggregatilineales bacterium]